MSPETYDVYFSGALLKTADPAETKRKIGAMFKLEGDKLERLFSGKPVPIKRGVDMEQAVRFRVAFRDAGALVDIVPNGQPAPDPASRPTPPQRPAAPTAAPTPIEPAAQPALAASAPPHADDSGLSLADGPLPEPAPADAPPMPVPDYGLSAPEEFNLSDCATPVEAAPLPDISALDLDKAGAMLDESPEPAPLEIDTEALMLDDPGTPLVEEEAVSPPPIDTDQLTLSAANEGTLEGFQKAVEPAPLPNIDHLDLLETEEKPKSQGKATFVIADD
jgi:hypothetical protein